MRIALLAALSACGFQLGPSGVEIDAPPFVDDGGGLSELWMFDTASDFEAVGHDRVAMAIEQRGSLTPEGYVHGALLGRGLTTMKLWSNGDTAWTKLATVTPTGIGMWTGAELTTQRELTYLGIRRNAPMRTVWFEGELLLGAGTERLQIKGDDVAFLEIASPGTSSFTPLLENSATPVATVLVPITGWYPVRIGWADGDGSGNLGLEIAGQTGFAAIPPNRLRAAVASVPGVLRTVFYRQLHGGGILGTLPPVQQIQPTQLLMPTSFAPPLQGSVGENSTATETANDWSARWAGQLYATTPGMYTVRVDSDDGHRVFLGSAPVGQSNWGRNDDNGNASTTVTSALREGWNDLVVDYNQNGGASDLAVRVVTSPDAALVDAPIPISLLRPIEPRGERLITRSTVPTPSRVVADDTGAFSDLDVRVATGPMQMVTRVDVTVVYNTDTPDQLVFRVIRPGGTPVIVRNHQGGFIGGTRIVAHAFSVDAAVVGGPADGTWKIGVADDVNGAGNNTTSIDEVHLTLHTAGGPEQIATTSSWRTPIKDLGTRLVKIDRLTWDARTPAGSGVELRLRSCEQADCSDEPSWGDPQPKDMPVVLPQRRHVQAQVTMTTDGVSEPELRALSLMYRRTSM